jgi:hypothetical protein
VRCLFLLTKLTEALGHLTFDRRLVRLDAGALSIVDMGTTDGYVVPPLSVQRPNDVIHRPVTSRIVAVFRHPHRDLTVSVSFVCNDRTLDDESHPAT